MRVKGSGAEQSIGCLLKDRRRGERKRRRQRQRQVTKRILTFTRGGA